MKRSSLMSKQIQFYSENDIFYNKNCDFTTNKFRISVKTFVMFVFYSKKWFHFKKSWFYEAWEFGHFSFYNKVAILQNSRFNNINLWFKDIKS